MKNSLRQGLGLHIQKSYIEGVYSDNSQNRKLGRVGMSYGHSLNLEGFEDVEDDGYDYTIDPKVILKRAKKILSEKAFNLVKSLMESDNFHKGDIAFYNNKIHFTNFIEVDPEINKDIINLGERKEIEPQKEQDYYKFIRETWSPDQLEKKWLRTFEKEESWGTAKYYSMLARLKMEDDIRKNILRGEKRELWWKLYKKGKVDYEFEPEDYTDEEVEKFIKIHGRKITKDQLAYSSKHQVFIEALKNYGIDFSLDKDEIDKFKDQFKKYIITCPRNEFYQVVKNIQDSSYIHSLIQLRFAFKYNKMLAGQGWGDLSENGKIDIKKRDEVIELCKQLEYAVDDVLGDDKDLFINNPNIDFIRFDKNIEWGGASYNKYSKVITITSEYFQSMKGSRKNNKRASTLSREKFMVEGFIHEIGHSLDITADIYDSDIYKDFARHLGYDKNRLYTIYANAINEDSGVFDNQDYYLSIKKDKKQELINKFKKLHDKYWGGLIEFDNKELVNIFLSEYSTKSVSEGFAEYFSFYVGNKNVIDKEIEQYNKNSKEYLSKANIRKWYKYSVYSGKWDFLFGDDNPNLNDEMRKYYEAVIQYNIEMLSDIQKIVKMAKRKMK